MSPAVWADCKPRIQAAATAASMAVAWPNESGDEPSPPAIWLDVEVAAEAADNIELGDLGWEEKGQIFLHVMIPIGSGIDDGLAKRKALSNAFRVVTNAATGLTYRDGQAFDPLGPATDRGVYRDLTLIVRYVFQDTPT